MHVMLKRSRSGNFRRTIRDDSGKELAVVELAPGETYEIKSDDDLVAFGGDVGGALQECRFSDIHRKFVPLKESKLPEAAKILRDWRKLAPEKRGERPVLPTNAIAEAPPSETDGETEVKPGGGHAVEPQHAAKPGKGAKALLAKE